MTALAIAKGQAQLLHRLAARPDGVEAARLVAGLVGADRAVPAAAGTAGRLVALLRPPEDPPASD